MYFVMEFFMLVWFVFVLCNACKLSLWCCKGCMPVQYVKAGLAATHSAVLESIGICAPTQAIPATQQAELDCFIYQQSFFIFVCILNYANNTI